MARQVEGFPLAVDGGDPDIEILVAVLQRADQPFAVRRPVIFGAGIRRGHDRVNRLAVEIGGHDIAAVLHPAQHFAIGADREVVAVLVVAGDRRDQEFPVFPPGQRQVLAPGLPDVHRFAIVAQKIDGLAIGRKTGFAIMVERAAGHRHRFAHDRVHHEQIAPGGQGNLKTVAGEIDRAGKIVVPDLVVPAPFFGELRSSGFGLDGQFLRLGVF